MKEKFVFETKNHFLAFPEQQELDGRHYKEIFQRSISDDLGVPARDLHHGGNENSTSAEN